MKYIKEYEKLGVPENITETGEDIYNKILENLKEKLRFKVYNEKLEDDTKISLLIEGEFNISDYNFNTIETNVIFNVASNIDEMVIYSYGFNFEAESTRNPKFMKYSGDPNLVKLSIEVAIPLKKELKLSDFITLLEKDSNDIITSLTHEFSHSYEKYKKPIESIINRNNYTTYKQIRMNIKPLDEFSHLLYLTSETENTVRPSEVASEMKQKNITKSQFNDFIKNNDTYKKLMKAKNFSYEKLKKELLENIKDIDIFIKEHRDIYDDIPNSNEEKVNLILKTYYSSIINLKMQNIQSMLKLDHPFAQFFLSDMEERIDIHNKYAKKITKQKKFDKFFEFEEKRINFAADKMIKKIYKLYDMAKDDNTTEKLKISKEIKDWDLYHEVKKTKTEFTTEIKKTDFRKKK